MIWENPIRIKGRIASNRIVFPPVSPNWATREGLPTDQMLRWYGDIAFGGCGMVVVSGTAISAEGKGTDRSLCLFAQEHSTGLRPLSKIIQKHCIAIIQLMHVGGQGNPVFTGHMPVSPSGVICKALNTPSRPLSVIEIKELRNKFISSAIMAAEAGFDGVELHLAHGYLLHEFLSRHTNKRKDIYGGKVENRARLIVEIVNGIKRRCASLIIGARVSGEDFIENGINFDENKTLLPLLEKEGIDYFSVTAGIYDTSALKHQSMMNGEFFEFSKEIKGVVTKPVIGVGKILDLERAETQLRNSSCDMVAIGRGLIADPFMIQKTKQGASFKRCTECDQCQFLRFGRDQMTCSQWEHRDE